MLKFRRVNIILLAALILSVLLSACGGSATNTPAPAPTTAAPATTAPTVATTAPPAPATTAPVVATTAPAKATTAAPASSVLGSFTELAVAKEVNDAFIKTLAATFNLKDTKGVDLSYYVSDQTDLAKATDEVDAALVKTGYKFALPGETKPAKTGTTGYIGLYTKSSSKDVLVSISTIDNSNPTAALAGLKSIGVSDTEAQKYIDSVKNKKTALFFMEADGLVSSLTAGSTPAAATTAPSTSTNPATGSVLGSFSMLEVSIEVNKAFVTTVANAFKLKDPQTISLSYFVSEQTDLAKAATEVDAVLVKAGYKFTLPGQTKPLANGTNGYFGVYTKSGEKDVLLLVSPIDTSKPDEALAGLKAIGVSDTQAKNYLDSVKGKNSAVVLMEAPGLAASVASFIGASGAATPAASTGSIISTYTQLTIPASINKAVGAVYGFSDLTGLQFQYFGSPNPDLAKAVAEVDTALIANGYKLAIPNETKPKQNGSNFIGFYTKAGQPDVFFVASPIPEDFSTTVTGLASTGVSADEIQAFITAFKGNKSSFVYVYGTNLAKSLNF